MLKSDFLDGAVWISYVATNVLKVSDWCLERDTFKRLQVRHYHHELPSYELLFPERGAMHTWLVTVSPVQLANSHSMLGGCTAPEAHAVRAWALI